MESNQQISYDDACRIIGKLFLESQLEVERLLTIIAKTNKLAKPEDTKGGDIPQGASSS